MARAFWILALLLWANSASAQSRTRDVATFQFGGNTVAVRAASTGHVTVAVQRGVRYATWVEFSPTAGEILTRADAALFVDPETKAAPGEEIEYDGPFFTDRYGSVLRISLRIRAARSYLLYVADKTGVHETVTVMNAAQYRQFRAALGRAVKAAYDMMG